MLTSSGPALPLGELGSCLGRSHGRCRRTEPAQHMYTNILSPCRSHKQEDNPHPRRHLVKPRWPITSAEVSSRWAAVTFHPRRTLQHGWPGLGTHMFFFPHGGVSGVQSGRPGLPFMEPEWRAVWRHCAGHWRTYVVAVQILAKVTWVMCVWSPPAPPQAHESGGCVWVTTAGCAEAVRVRSVDWSSSVLPASHCNLQITLKNYFYILLYPALVREPPNTTAAIGGHLTPPPP